LFFLGDLAYQLAHDQGPIHLGDAYNYLADKSDGQNGNKFVKKIYPVTSQAPFMMTIGNHETFPDLTDFENRFWMPNHEITKNHYYSFGVNNIHFTCVNGVIIDWTHNNPFNVNNYIPTLQKWIDNDLKGVKPGVWKIVYMHRPLYCSHDDGHCKGEAEKMRNIFEKIFNDNKVDLIIAGHLHSYERAFPIGIGQKVDTASLSSDKNTYTNPKYPSHVICGAAGQAEKLKTSPYKIKEFTKIAIGNHPGVCEFNVDSSGKKLSMKYINTENGSVEDTFSIVKSNKRRKMKLNKLLKKK